MSASSLSSFDAIYRRSADPWLTETRWYEQRKRAVVLACLPHQRYGGAYEPGCGNGVLTEALAARCDDVLASDGSERAVAAARRRLGPHRHVVVERHLLPGEWPTRLFDLVILSELVYFLDADAIEEVGRLATRGLSPTGVVLACHWRAPIEGYGQSGEEAHRRLAAAVGLRQICEYRDADFVVDAWSRDTNSVAMRESIR